MADDVDGSIEWDSRAFSSSQLVDDDAVDISESSLVVTMDSVPVVVYSVQFLEVDTNFNVINQDSSYVRNVDFVDGTIFNYTSIVARVDDVNGGAIVGGMNLVLRGMNAANEPVRNVFTITYTNDCGVPTFEVGDAIGWVVLSARVTSPVRGQVRHDGIQYPDGAHEWGHRLRRGL
ncbi:hypothetical protein ACHAXA_002586 [Cyclostephanos tholiformis]|uniref:Uncharacterized protein n=1 Tax=Cyclostephanos tholiformis TaxID=382380 RepID=A0ABD3R4R8_9STRA